jgi:hypothetical protein
MTDESASVDSSIVPFIKTYSYLEIFDKGKMNQLVIYTIDGLVLETHWKLELYLNRYTHHN